MNTLKIIIGTKNRKKKAEIEAILNNLPYGRQRTLCSLSQRGKTSLSTEPVELLTLDDLPSAPNVIEDGKTFAENATKKALTLANFFNMWVMADDSGLEVEALGNRPGVFSNRYAGEGATDEDNIKKLLWELRDIPDNKRNARFRCAIALAKPGNVLIVSEGQYEGVITREPRGKHGFGYDPVFLVPEYGRTFAELSPSEKNQISHRAQALRLFRNKLTELFSKVDNEVLHRYP